MVASSNYSSIHGRSRSLARLCLLVREHNNASAWPLANLQPRRPSVRETLLCRWRSYNLPKLARRLTQHVRFKLPSIPKDEALVEYDASTMELRLHQSVQNAMAGLENITLTPEICKMYPDLTPTITESTPPEASNIYRSISSNNTPQDLLSTYDPSISSQHAPSYGTEYGDLQPPELGFYGSFPSGVDVTNGMWYPYPLETYAHDVVL